MIFVVTRQKHKDVAAWFEARFSEWGRGVDRQDRTVTAFADYLGIDRTLVSHWINGIRRPSYENAKKIAEKLGGDVYSLVDAVPPDPDLRRIIRNWDNLPDWYKRQLLEEIERFEHENNSSLAET